MQQPSPFPAKERPIIFSGPMVRAILDGRKTQTRRVVRPQPPEDCAGYKELTDARWEACYWAPAISCCINGQRWAYDGLPYTKCPYGQPGDRLWVRETGVRYHTINRTKKPDGRSFEEVSDGLYAYRADGFGSIDDLRSHLQAISGLGCIGIKIEFDRWTPSIDMPRWASRIMLEVTGVRVERVQEISEKDARVEGVTGRLVQDPGNPDTTFTCFGVPFAELWESIYAKRGFGWDVNPYVWVIEFRRVNV